MPFTLLNPKGPDTLHELYQVIIEGAPVMLWLGDAHGKCVFLNRRQREFWGVPPDDLDGFDWSSTVHPEDIEELAGPFTEAMTNHTPMQVEARFRRASDGEYRILRTNAEPRFDRDGRFVGMVGVNIDLTEQRLAEADLRQARDAIALATQASQLGWVSWTFGDGTAQLDVRARQILGLSERDLPMRGWLDSLSAEDRVRVEQEIRASAAEARPYSLTFRLPGPDQQDRRVHATGMIACDASGSPVKGTGLLRDATDQWREEEFQRLMVRELSHRNKNLLSVVTALVKLTPTDDRSAQQFQSAVVGRLTALAAGMELSADAGPDQVEVQRLAESVLAPYLQDDADRVALRGPAMTINSSFSRSLGLALHELATNAVKYGALSVPDGTVTVEWDREPTDDGERFALAWRERGGPAPHPNGRTGFGSRLLQSIVALETGGTARYDMTPAGLEYDLSFSL